MSLIAVVLSSLASLTVVLVAIRQYFKGRSDNRIKEADDTKTISYLSRKFDEMEDKLNEALGRLARIEGYLWRGRRGQ